MAFLPIENVFEVISKAVESARAIARTTLLVTVVF
ncbi:MAG: hypothetical protein Ct9H300mP28_19330 [Pseudomonadota bacterium]|nr:MAG: hypothetical protein Ct9H300mP28_19330 [Pseudomonadota bacterium]